MIFAVPGDIRTQIKEDEKIEKYGGLRREISKLWGVQTTVTPNIIGALGTITDCLTSRVSSAMISTYSEKGSRDQGIMQR